MEVTELVTQVVKGSQRAFALPYDPSDPIRISVTTGIADAGWVLVHCPSMAELAVLTGQESLDFVQDKRVLLVPWPEDVVGIKQAVLCVRQLTPGMSIGFLSSTYPPPRGKDTASLLSLLATADPMAADSASPLLAGYLDASGLRATPGALRMLLNRAGGHTEALSRMVRALALFCGVGGEITEELVLEAVPYIPEDDGKKMLDDLLHLRALPLARRLQWVPVGQFVPLFRAAASEMVIVHQVALYAAASSKGWLDPGKTAESLGVREELMRSRYIPLAKELGKERVSKILSRLEQADTVLLRTSYDAREAATALAMQICRA